MLRRCLYPEGANNLPPIHSLFHFRSRWWPKWPPFGAISKRVLELSVLASARRDRGCYRTNQNETISGLSFDLDWILDEVGKKTREIYACLSSQLEGSRAHTIWV